MLVGENRSSGTDERSVLTLYLDVECGVEKGSMNFVEDGGERKVWNAEWRFRNVMSSEGR